MTHPCSHVGPDTEDGYGEGCDNDSTENGLCVSHGGVGCPICYRVGKEFTEEPHNSKCIADFNAFFEEAERKHAARPFAMHGCGCQACDGKEGGTYRGCKATGDDGMACDGPTPCPLHEVQGASTP